MHIKKSSLPTTWPVPRKGSTFVAVPMHGFGKGITVLYILRDMLKFVRSRWEAKYMAMNGMVKVNGQVRKDEVYPLFLYDTLTLDKAKKSYRLEIERRKFCLKEISGKEAEQKIAKIVGKRIVSGSKVQMNLDDGQNYLTDLKFFRGDSALVDVVHHKILKILPLKVGSAVEIIMGKHAGKRGKIVSLEDRPREKVYHVLFEEGKETELPLTSLLVVG